MEPIREAEMQTQPGKRLAEEPKRKKPGKAWKTAAGIVTAAVVVLFCACCMLANSRDTFFPHTVVWTSSWTLVWFTARSSSVGRRNP